MPFAWSINPYRGCYHQCVFCYARRTHTFLERSGLGDWGSVLSVKVNAPQVLRRELSSPRWRGEHVAIGTATDPYQPLEGSYRITRGILVELAAARTQAHAITRSPLVVRDIDVWQELARAAGASVCISLPTLDEGLARKIEPTVAPPRQRLRAIDMLADAGIRVGVAVAPILPGLTDGEAALREVFEAARRRRCEHGVAQLAQPQRSRARKLLRLSARGISGTRSDARPLFPAQIRAQSAGGRRRRSHSKRALGRAVFGAACDRSSTCARAALAALDVPLLRRPPSGQRPNRTRALVHR